MKLTNQSSVNIFQFEHFANNEKTTCQTPQFIVQEDNSHIWNMIIQSTQGVLTFIGMLGNVLVIIVLRQHRHMANFANCVFMHQSILDLFVCFISIAVILLSADLHGTGWTTVDIIICHIWTSQAIYWYFVFLSVQNLILVALDRYWAVFRPIRYKQIGTGHAALYMIILHAYSLLVNSADIFLVHYDNENLTCLSEPLYPGPKSTLFFNIYGILWFFLVYLIPVISVIMLYSIIIFRLTRHRTDENVSKNRQRAATELTKSSIIITVIFVFCFSYDCIYYLLGNLEILVYEFNTPTQTMGVFLVALNSCVNPAVYCITMRSFRTRMAATLCCRSLTFSSRNTTYNSTATIMKRPTHRCGSHTSTKVQLEIEEDIEPPEIANGSNNNTCFTNSSLNRVRTQQSPLTCSHDSELKPAQTKNSPILRVLCRGREMNQYPTSMSQLGERLYRGVTPYDPEIHKSSAYRLAYYNEPCSKQCLDCYKASVTNPILINLDDTITENI